MKTKWIFYTVLVGLIPIAARYLIWLTASNTSTVSVVSPVDIAFFGLTLQISNINSVEHAKKLPPSWKTGSNGFSVIFIALLGVIIAAAFMAEANPSQHSSAKLLTATLVLSVTSFFFSLTIVYKISKGS